MSTSADLKQRYETTVELLATADDDLVRTVACLKHATRARYRRNCVSLVHRTVRRTQVVTALIVAPIAAAVGLMVGTALF